MMLQLGKYTNRDTTIDKKFFCVIPKLENKKLHYEQFLILKEQITVRRLQYYLQNENEG